MKTSTKKIPTTIIAGLLFFMKNNISQCKDLSDDELINRYFEREELTSYYIKTIKRKLKEKCLKLETK